MDVETIKKANPDAECFTLPTGADALQLIATLRYMGTVNAGPFQGRPPGTVLFLGPQVGEGLKFAYLSVGWNKRYCAEAGAWIEVTCRDTMETPYRVADFGPLAALLEQA